MVLNLPPRVGQNVLFFLSLWERAKPREKDRDEEGSQKGRSGREGG